MITFLKSFYLTSRFFYALACIAVLFLLSNWFSLFYGITWVIVVGFFITSCIETMILYLINGLDGKRLLPEKFSNSDENEVIIQLHNSYGFQIIINLIDEIPFQFQKRDFLIQKILPAKSKGTAMYLLRPVDRGEYIFGKLNCFVSTNLSFVQRRFIFSDAQMVKVYPSFIQMKKYDFLAIHNRLSNVGLKKIRRIGHTMEFEQIKEYIPGDDVRTVNWKATAKLGQLMVNQYQDEKMQPVYTIIDTSRIMKMPFNQLKLVDYAINSALAFSNVALKKGDKVGLIAFSHKIEKQVIAQNKKTHLNTLLEALYNIDSKYLDSDYGMLQSVLKKTISHRSLLLLYTNFEHMSSLKRQLPYLQAIAKKHLLVVIFFENTELQSLMKKEAKNIPQIFDQTVAQQFDFEKKLMVLELQQKGIQTLLTAPEDLSVNTINKYLEIKARGLL